MTGNAGPILLITNKGRTIRKLMGGGGGGTDVQKKIVAHGNEKNSCWPINPKKYSYYGLKRFIQGFDNEKKNDYTFFYFLARIPYQSLNAYIHAHIRTHLLGRPTALFRVNVTVIVINTEN